MNENGVLAFAYRLFIQRGAGCCEIDDGCTEESYFDRSLILLLRFINDATFCRFTNCVCFPLLTCLVLCI